MPSEGTAPERGDNQGSGYDPVFGEAAIREIARVIGPAELGLEPVSDRRFAARHGDFIKILEIASFKGASYALLWGVSLPSFCRTQGSWQL